MSAQVTRMSLYRLLVASLMLFGLWFINLGLPIGPVSPQEREVLAIIREIGRVKDRSRLGYVLKALDHESARVRALAAIVISRMSIQEAKAKLQELSISHREDGPAAKIALSRLAAEANRTDVVGKIRVFLSTLGMSVEQFTPYKGKGRGNYKHQKNAVYDFAGSG